MTLGSDMGEKKKNTQITGKKKKNKNSRIGLQREKR